MNDLINPPPVPPTPPPNTASCDLTKCQCDGVDLAGLSELVSLLPNYGRLRAFLAAIPFSTVYLWSALLVPLILPLLCLFLHLLFSSLVLLRLLPFHPFWPICQLSIANWIR